jgi:hypothetical protein
MDLGIAEPMGGPVLVGDLGLDQDADEIVSRMLAA